MRRREHVHKDGDRQTGRTTRQLRGAALGALFVWCNEAVSYPKTLAADIGRHDIQIEPLSILDRGYIVRFRGCIWSEVIIDHAARLTGEQAATLREVRPFIERRECSSYAARG